VGIRLKLGLGFAALIVLLSSLTWYWGARSLGLSIDSSDSLRLVNLREQWQAQWRHEQDTLKGLGAEVAKAFAPYLIPVDDVADGTRSQTSEAVPVTPATLEVARLIADRLRAHLRLEWIELRHEGRPLLYPGVTMADLPENPPPEPIRLATDGPLSLQGYLVAVQPVMGTPCEVVLMRRSGSPVVPLASLWDTHGYLAGEAGVADDLWYRRELARSDPGEPVVSQILHQGRLYRLRVDERTTGSKRLLVGYEADASTLTRAGVSDLLIQLAMLQTAGFLLLGYFLGRRLFQPLERLREGMERVAAGQWQKIPEEGGDEIGEVARSFNRMVQDLALAQTRLLEIQRELVAKEKMAVLGRFSAGVAHEINNPLGTILVCAGNARESLDSAGTVDAEDLASIVEATKRCRQIVDSLLNYARNRPPERSQVELSELVRDAVVQLKPERDAASILVCAAEVPETRLSVDGRAMVQVLRNLLANACDAVQGLSSPRVEIRCRAPEPGWVEVSVLDNGPGLPGGENHLFEPFYSTKSKGTGLGLAISQSIVESHGGRLWAERLPEDLTAFRFTIPTFAGGGDPLSRMDRHRSDTVS